MKKYIRLAFTALIVYIAQASFINLFTFGSISINMLLVLAIFINWEKQTAESTSLSAVLGALADSISPVPFGTNLLLFFFLSIIIQYLVLTKVTNHSYGSLVVAILAGYGIYNMLFILGIKQNYFGILGSWNDILSYSKIFFTQIIILPLLSYALFRYGRYYEKKKTGITI